MSSEEVLSPLAPEELADRVGVDRQAVAEWVELGLLPVDAHGALDASAPERARLLRFVTERGIAAAAVARLAEEEGDVLARWLSYTRPLHGTSRMLGEAATEVGLDLDLARRLWSAAGRGHEPELFDDDVEMLRTAAFAVQVGLPADAIVQLVRVFADALGRIADAETRLFHFHVHERLRTEGLAGRDLVEQTRATGDALLELTEPSILYFHQRAWDRALREDLVMHLAEDVTSAASAAMPIAVLFVDLASFTPLTDAMGDVAAAAVLDRFSELVRDAAAQCHGRVVKQIGDEFMLSFPVPSSAVRCGLEIADRAAHEPRFPALRMGAHAGTALFREADYLGATVNIAARVAAKAGRGQFLVTEAVVSDTTDLAVGAWKALGPRQLKGVTGPVELYEAVRDGQRPARHTDPVCGMQLDADEDPYRLSWQGQDHLFCSETCLRRFVEMPEQYGAAGS
ncbi:MAG: YHS domain-containing protein [Actinobacteria bacterium]|nr:YHS domain-containing protein [Actinomycetota bacterium]